MDDHLIINLRVADMRYPIRIKREDEEIYRKAANEIDYKLGQYKNYFQGERAYKLDDINYVVMTAIQALGEKVEEEHKTTYFRNKIQALNQELDKFLSDI